MTCLNVRWDVSVTSTTWSYMYGANRMESIKICKTLFYDTMFCQKHLFSTWDQGKLLANLVKLGPLLRFTRSRKTFCSDKLSSHAKDEYRDICRWSNCPNLRDYTQFVFILQPYLFINIESSSLGVDSLGHVHTFSMMLAYKDIKNL